MKIFSCVPCQYYNNPEIQTYEYISFVEVLKRMGNEVHAIDHKVQAKMDKEGFNRFFLSVAKHGRYDLVIIVTHRDEFFPEILDEVKKYTVLMAWNCDDDWRWEDYSSKWIKHYTYMVTTYRHIFEANRKKYPNLMLSQWGCTGLCDGMDIYKDIDISFVGQIYGKRIQQMGKLKKHFKFLTYGEGVHLNGLKDKIKKRLAKFLRIPWKKDTYLLSSQNEVKKIWNRSKISFTPLDASRKGAIQIKARVFDMGLSETVMLCTKNPALYEFYEPGKEFMEFENMEECIEKTKYLLANNSKRKAIAKAYYDRTKKEHLFEYRFNELFDNMELKKT